MYEVTYEPISGQTPQQLVEPLSDKCTDTPAQPRESACAGRPPGFCDPNEAAGREVGIKLLSEILEYQRLLNQHLDFARLDFAYLDLAHRDSEQLDFDHRDLEAPQPASPKLAIAWRRAIRVRREMLRDLPGYPPSQASDAAGS